MVKPQPNLVGETSNPIGSMGLVYIHLHEWLICMVHVGCVYTIHGSYGVPIVFWYASPRNLRINPSTLTNSFDNLWSWHMRKLKIFAPLGREERFSEWQTEKTTFQPPVGNPSKMVVKNKGIPPKIHETFRFRNFYDNLPWKLCFGVCICSTGLKTIIGISG